MNNAGVKHFYIEFVDNIESDYSKVLIEHLSVILPRHDYFISEESANKGWPYYEEVVRGAKVLKTDMMPPHTSINRISPIGQLKNYNQGEHSYKAIFTINNLNENLISITKESFTWKEDKWQKMSMKISTKFKVQDSNQIESFTKIAKTLVRYTFK